MGDDITVEVEVEPMYEKVRFIAHCLMTVANQVYERGTGEKVGDFKTMREQWPALSWKNFYGKEQEEIESERKRKRFDLKQDLKYNEVAANLNAVLIPAMKVEEDYLDAILLAEDPNKKPKAVIVSERKRKRIDLMQDSAYLDVKAKLNANLIAIKDEEDYLDAILLVEDPNKKPKEVIASERKRKRFELKQDLEYQEVEAKLNAVLIPARKVEEDYLDKILLAEDSTIVTRFGGDKGETQVYACGKWKMKYNGLPGSELDNIKAVAAFVKAAIEEAAKNIGADKKEELKLYMLPEAFFLGNKGAYEVENVSALMEELQKVVMEAKWKHWIFALGTVNGVYIDEDDGKVSGMFNMAPVLRGGCGNIAKAPDYTWLIPKVTFCQEIPGAGELVGDGHTEDEVGFQFGATETEYKLGKRVQELLNQDVKIGVKSVGEVFTEQGLSPAHWEALKGTVGSQVFDRGLYAVVRDVRKITRPEGGTLAESELWGADVSGKVDSYGKRESALIEESWQFVVRLLMTSYLLNPVQW